jgi:hypothetical protein
LGGKDTPLFAGVVVRGKMYQGKALQAMSIGTENLYEFTVKRRVKKLIVTVISNPFHE